MNFNNFCDEAHKIAKEKGWWDKERNVGEILMLVVSELSEAMEEYRDGGFLDEVRYGTSGKPEGFPIEIADTLIRIADLCGKYDIDIEEAVKIKMSYNLKRPYRHGGKVA